MLKLCKKKFQSFADTAEIRPGVYVVGCSKISIGNRVAIRPGSMIHGMSDNLTTSIIIEDDVLLGSGVHMYVSNHCYDNPDIPIYDQGHYPSEPIIIRKGAWLGANVIVLPGVEIGANTVVAAGAVVTKSLPAKVVAGGVPAKIIKTIQNFQAENKG
ncbi:acyltransferase [Chitinophaga oryziterrae]|uniref:Acyltransferase n=2 Tax=Chitinophaga oryziterrae TaxID=1031224 RepID=A0A6N8J6D0_9BACT|nr:acyltransferase [Chitinophaga oryziterrae]